MKKTFLALSFSSVLVLGLQSGASAQQVKYTVEQTNLIEVKQSQNGWQKQQPVYLNSKPAPAQQRPAQTNSAAQVNSQHGLPAIKAPRAGAYLLNRGSGKTRRQSRSPEEVAGSQNAVPSPNQTAGKDVPAAKVPARPPAKVRNVYSSPSSPKAWTTGTKRVTWTEDLGRKQSIKKTKPKSSDQSGAATYAATYGAYDQSAKKKRNY